MNTGPCDQCRDHGPRALVFNRLLCKPCDENTRLGCHTCGKPVERPRRCYAVPTCYGCLPPPEILHVSSKGGDT
jgi:hypothetical protein